MTRFLSYLDSFGEIHVILSECVDLDVVIQSSSQTPVVSSSQTPVVSTSQAQVASSSQAHKALSPVQQSHESAGISCNDLGWSDQFTVLERPKPHPNLGWGKIKLKKSKLERAADHAKWRAHGESIEWRAKAIEKEEAEAEAKAQADTLIKEAKASFQDHVRACKAIEREKAEAEAKAQADTLLKEAELLRAAEMRKEAELKEAEIQKESERIKAEAEATAQSDALLMKAQLLAAELLKAAALLKESLSRQSCSRRLS
jgi:hypothetical protein